PPERARGGLFYRPAGILLEPVLVAALRIMAALAYMPAGLGRHRRCPLWFPGVRRGLSSLNDVARRGRFVQGTRYVAAGSGRGKSVHSPPVAGHQGTGVGQQTGISGRPGRGSPTCMAVAPLGSTVRIRTLTSRRTSAASRRTCSTS